MKNVWIYNPVIKYEACDERCKVFPTQVPYSIEK